jgi:hypothetical protein
MVMVALIAALTGCTAAPASALAATLSVTTLGDSGPGSLRQAIADAAPGDRITFAVGGTITLTSGELAVTKDLTISGPGAGNLSISGNLAAATLERVIDNSAKLTISGVTIRSGTAVSGGGILNSGDLVVTDTVITDNRARGEGGGIFNSGTLHVTNATISNNLTELFNAADASGAGIYNAGTATISHTTFFDNLVHDNGSALFNGATATVTDSTFSFNQMNGIGAVYNDKTSTLLALDNVTITANVGSKQSTGLFSAGGTVNIANSIVAGNSTQGRTSLPDCAGTITSAGHNLVGNATGCGLTAGTGDQVGSDVAPIDARLGPLASNGGPTRTHALLAGSPAIDAGSPAAAGSGASACGTTDQRGAARPALGATSLTCDIGAVEIGSTPPTPPPPPPSTDIVPPLPGGPPLGRFVPGSVSGIPVRLRWTDGTDAGSGIGGYVLQRKVDAGAFVTIARPASTIADVSLGAGHAYQFRVAAVDRAGNTSPFVAGPAFRVGVTQERSRAIRYSRGWVLATSAAYWGGHARNTRTSRASATFTFTGRNVAWVASMNRHRGRARVFVDGHLVTTVNLFSATSRSRQIVFSRAWTRSSTHRVRIVGLATARHPIVTLDAMIVLR